MIKSFKILATILSVITLVSNLLPIKAMNPPLRESVSKCYSYQEKRREEVDAKNEAENLCYAIEKLLNENGDKIDQADKDSLNEKVKKLKETITSGNIDSIKSETESLQKAMYEVSAKLYQNAQAAQQAAPNAATGAESQTNDSANGNVYDADFKDVDNK